MNDRILFTILLAAFVVSFTLFACADDDDDDDNDDDVSNDDDDNDDNDDDDDTAIDDDDLTVTYLEGGISRQSNQAIVSLSDGRITVAGSMAGRLFVHRFAPAVGWTSESLATFGSAPALLADADNVLHMVYGDDRGQRVRHAVLAGGEWSHETIEESVGGQALPAFAIDAQGSLHVAYTTGDGGALHYATNVDGQWQNETVLTGEIQPGTLSLALDQNNRPLIAYMTTSTDGSRITLARRESSDWTNEDVSSHGGAHTMSLAVDGDNVVHLAFGNYYAVYKDGDWQFDAFDRDVDTDIAPSLRLGNDGTARIAYTATYYDANPDDDDEKYTVINYVRYAEKNGDDWQIHTLTDEATDAIGLAALTLNDDGDPLIAYSDNYLQYAARLGGEWSKHRLADAMYAGDHLDMDIDSTGRPHVMHFFGDEEWDTQPQVRYLTTVEGQWQGETVGDVDFYLTSDKESSLVVDGQDRVHLFFSNHDLLHLRRDADDWREFAISNSYDGTRPSAVRGPDGAVHLAFGANGIQYGVFRDNTWSNETVFPNTHKMDSLAVDVDGFAHVTFDPGINTHLAYRTNKSGDWLGGAIYEYGHWAETGVDSQGGVHVVYIGLGLQHATLVDNVPLTTDIDMDIGSNTLPSLAVDANDALHVSYPPDEFGTELRYAENMTGDWRIHHYPSWGKIGKYTAIALDGQGNTLIAFQADDALWLACIPHDSLDE